MSSLFLLLLCVQMAAADWQTARRGWNYVFPRDHGPHPEFKTEWLYFTGNLRDQKGRRFGYELTLFRHGVRPESERTPEGSRFLIGDLKFAHFAISDVAGQRFHYQQKLSRGAFGEAGFGTAEGRLAWIDGWSIDLAPDGVWRLRAKADGFALDLSLSSIKPWVIHGVDGVSQKAPGENHASHYYSGTRLESRGELFVEGVNFQVTGESWFDHEWATNQLAANQLGWNWFSIQLDDKSELMLYQMRLRDGSIDPASSGSVISPEGKVTHLRRGDYELIPVKYWKNKAGIAYPIEWKAAVPSLGLELRITTPLENQELAFPSLSYWEGLIDISGSRAGARVGGHGYMELTGYAGPLVGLGK
ncbi:MAG: lipocalin-like domain-containing protein [Verrucomicrobiota bacterium]